MEHKSDGYTNCIGCCWYSHQMIGKRTRGVENKGTSRENPNYSIAEIGQNTEKSPGDLERLVVTQISVKNFKGSKPKIIEETISLQGC